MLYYPCLCILQRLCIQNRVSQAIHISVNVHDSLLLQNLQFVIPVNSDVVYSAFFAYWATYVVGIFSLLWLELVKALLGIPFLIVVVCLF